jgi:HAD superfamily hydrolase (TIGR01549 family)
MDGTLIDSYKTIYNAMILTLDEQKIPHSINEIEFIKRIGQHFKDIFEAFNVEVDDFDSYLKLYKNIYMEQINHSRLYPGVLEVLTELKNNKKNISLLTTKAQDQAEKIVDYFGLKKYFDIVMGRQDGIAHKPSPEPLLKICNDLNINIVDTLIIGDTELDIQCGKNAGSSTCAVTYGYRSKDLIENERPDFIINRFEEILSLDKN